MEFKSPEDFHNKIGFTFHAILALPLAAFVYLFLEVKNRGRLPIVEDPRASLVTGIVLFVGIAVVVAGYLLFKKQMKANNEVKQPLKDKLAKYYNAALTFYLLLELGSIAMVLGLYLTTSSFFIIGFMFLLLIQSLNRPTPQKYVKDLRLSEEERNIILHKKPFNQSE